MVNSVKIKVLRLVKMLLGSGMSIKKISLCIALGAVLGIFPVVGSTTILCAIAALLMRLNLPAIQAINYLVYPLQIVLLVPFYSAGNWLFGDRSSPIIEKIIFDLLKNDIWGGMADLWDLTVYAVILWLMISPLIVLILYSLLKPVIRRIAESSGFSRSLKRIITS